MKPKDIKSMSLLELEDDFKRLSVESYRASQIFKWLSIGTLSFDFMTNISKSLRNKLNIEYTIMNAVIVKKLVSEKDETIKYAFKLNDGEIVESVIMKYKHGYSICISTQVGCKMGCSFCATAGSGFSRNLYPSEMLSQIQAAQQDLGVRISNVVLMGMGEPLDNYWGTLKFLTLVSCEEGLNIGMRHISVSTCGLVDKIYKLSEENLKITLSVSLHASDDDTRNMLVPVNRKWNISELIRACKVYIERTGRRISFEYAMIDNINDCPEHAHRLCEMLKGMLCHVNLIPLNESGCKGLKRSKRGSVKAFSDILLKRGINVTVRRELGSDINASCGQLRRSVCKGEA